MTIKVPFTVEGLDEAIKQIDAYKQSLNAKCQRLAQLIAERVAWSASQGFSGSIADDIVKPPGERPTPNVTVSIDDRGTIQVVMAEGKDAVFVEFGAGVHYNGGKGMIGRSPNPLVEKNGLPFTIGSYDKGNGRKEAWGWIEDETLYVSRGTPAAMPMYHGVQEARAVILDLAREVFSA